MEDVIKRLEGTINRLSKSVEMMGERYRWQSVADASVTLGYTKRQLTQWCKDGTLDCKRIGNGKKYAKYKIDVLTASERIAASDEYKHKSL
jgi:hypothetical protein